MKERNLSHDDAEGSFEASLLKIRSKILERKDLPYASLEQQLAILDLISQSELGCFLIQRGGLNGYWTQYVVNYGQEEKKAVNPVEAFVLEKAPTSLATQQRFQIFKTEIQKHIKEGVKMASIPCGLMAELLDLDFSRVKKFELVGMDIDQESLEQAAIYAKQKGLENHCRFMQADAWDLKIDQQFDLIASNGLSVYEGDDDRVTDLFIEFFKALKPGGCLVTSFLTPVNDWDVGKVVQVDALMQKLIFADILGCKWQTFRTHEVTKRQLESAGFIEIEVRNDRASIFPTMIAKKSD